MEAVEDRPEEEKRGWDAKEGQDGTRVRGRVPAPDSGKGDPTVTVSGRIFALAKER